MDRQQLSLTNLYYFYSYHSRLFTFFHEKKGLNFLFSIFVIVAIHFVSINLFSVKGFPCDETVPKHNWNQQRNNAHHLQCKEAG